MIGTDQTHLKVSIDPEDADSLRRISLDDPEPSGDYAEALEAINGQTATSSAVIMDRDEYFQQFCFYFDAMHEATAIIPDSRFPTLQSLMISEPEKPAARRASDALYKMAFKYPKILGWSLVPMNETMKATLPLTSFIVLKIKMIQMELAQKMPGFIAKRAAKKAGRGILGKLKGKKA